MQLFFINNPVDYAIIWTDNLNNSTIGPKAQIQYKSLMTDELINSIDYSQIYYCSSL